MLLDDLNGYSHVHCTVQETALEQAFDDVPDHSIALVVDPQDLSSEEKGDVIDVLLKS